MVQNIHIQINRLKLYKVTVNNGLTNNVIKDEPFDDLSNRFNKYRHIPKYPPGIDYDPNDYVLCLDDPNAWYYTYILYLYKPSIQIVSVDIFFDSNDNERRNPLIFGFNHVDNTSLYYSYYHLRGIKYFTGSIGKDGLIKKEDLMTRLIDERGLYIKESYNKFIIRLGDKPNQSEITYPNSGQNKERITLKKTEPEKYPNYVKFEHVINKLNNVESFYLSFHENTLYMIAESKAGKLKYVHVYYNKHDGEIPVVVVLKFASRTKLYKFSDLNDDFPKKTKNISALENFSEDDLEKTLIEEFRQVKKEITFKKGSGTNSYILITAHRFHLGNMDEFRRIILKPNLDKSKGGDPTGPYYVFNDNLLKKYSNTKIPDYLVNSLNGKKFSSIYVYFTSHYEPLLIGFIAESEKTFFKISKGGKSWEKEETIKIYSDSELIPKLRDLQKVSKVLVSHGKVQISGPSHPRGRAPRPSAPAVSVQHETITIKIDLSDTAASSNYEYGKVQFVRKDYDGCDLFYYFTHSLKDNSSFAISSLSFVKFNKRITNITDFYKMVKSVNVYFNKYNLNSPVMLSITPEAGKTTYYKGLIQSGSTYQFSTLKTVDEKDLTEELINESDEVNKSVTCHLDKTTQNTTKYGRESLISLTKHEDDKHVFSIFTHKQNTGKPFKGYVLLKNKIVLGWSNNRKTSLSIQNKNYSSIKVYFLNTDPNLPLLLEFNEQTIATYYIKNTYQKGEYWTNLDIKFDGDESIKSKLFEINYPLKNSVIIQIDKKDPDPKKGFNYPMKMISNKRTSDDQYEEILYEKSKPIDSKKVEVSHSNIIQDRSNRNQRPFYYVSHQLEEPNSQSINRKDIAGVRFFVNTIEKSQPEEVFFYENDINAKNSKDSLFFYYPLLNSASQKIFVYFYDDDPRPLLISYGEHAYKKLNKDDYTKWVRAGKAKYNDFTEQLKILKSIFGTLEKKLTLAEQGNIDTNIKENKNQDFGSYKQDIYSVKLHINDQKTSFKLPINKLVENLEKDTSLYKLFDNIFNKSFDTINVYKIGNGSTVKNILVFELINDSRTTHFQRKDREGKYWVEEEIVYDDSRDLQSRLQVIRSKVEKTIVYEIDKKNSNYNNYISLDTNSEFSYEYTEYLHSPQSDYYNFYGYILYRGQRLMVKNSGAQIVPLDTVQDEPYIKVSVYFGSRREEVPLILEFIFSNRSHSKTYYKHMKYESRSYWESIKIRPGVSELEDLITQLKLVESNLFKSIVILMDIRKGKYGDTKIKDAIPKLTNKKEIDTYPMDQECITVTDKTQQSKSNCLTNSGYAVYEHNLHNCIKDKHTCLLRFFIRSSKSSNNYSELNLFDSDSIDTLYYSKPTGDSKVYIYYYYGTNNRFAQIEDTDPRPLLIGYGNDVYKAKNKDGYFDSWHKVSNISDFLCQRSGGNPSLINALSNVVGFLNEVQLDQRPKITKEMSPLLGGSETIIYDIQTYNNQSIKIQVSYHNGSCFRCYRHEPYGINGRGQGYRLGNLTYNRKQNIGLNYEISKQLKAVNVYYNLYDYSHEHPLFISLEFKEGRNKDYFELNDKRVKKWNKLNENIDDDNIEYRIKSLISSLQVDFNKGKEADTLFDTNECYEESNNDVIIKATSGTLGTLATVGTTVGVTAATHPEWFIPVIRALI